MRLARAAIATTLLAFAWTGCTQSEPDFGEEPRSPELAERCMDNGSEPRRFEVGAVFRGGSEVRVSYTADPGEQACWAEFELVDGSLRVGLYTTPGDPGTDYAMVLLVPCVSFALDEPVAEDTPVRSSTDKGFDAGADPDAMQGLLERNLDCGEVPAIARQG